MHKDVADELTKGMQLALSLCEHLKTMGAESANIPVQLDGCDYAVKVMPGKTQETE